MSDVISRVLVYIDGTEESVTAAEYAVCLARSSGAYLCALYVVNTRALQDLLRARIFIESEEQEYAKDLEADAERYLNHVAELASAKDLPLERRKVEGSVLTEIKKAVRELKIDTLVIGALSRVQSRRDELYNEVERAVRSVDCTVIIAKDEDRIWSLYEEL
ncbi:universal stress protein [Marispirochaeta sp.]|jgi:nucleotide-binding universal stress UspA family protein|uniref:universal stress protein n=1 Tax=Marispirochaeta sp. TaxID=2038653 RepID=UPI0029C70F04|nr:universal stress protein [Marispirochaeta sp.]